MNKNRDKIKKKINVDQIIYKVWEKIDIIPDLLKYNIYYINEIKYYKYAVFIVWLLFSIEHEELLLEKKSCLIPTCEKGEKKFLEHKYKALRLLTLGSRVNSLRLEAWNFITLDLGARGSQGEFNTTTELS